MSTLEDIDDMEREEKGKKQDGSGDGDDGKKPEQNGDVDMADADGEKKDEEEEKEEDILDDEILHASTRDIQMRKRLLDNDLRINKSELQRLSHESATMKDKIKENLDKIENNRCVQSLARVW